MTKFVKLTKFIKFVKFKKFKKIKKFKKGLKNKCYIRKEKRKKDDDDIDKRLRNLKTDLQYISKGQRSKREVGEIRERDSFVCSGQSYNSYNAAQKFSTFHVDSLFVKKDFVQLLKTTTKNEKGPGQDSNFITMLN